MNLQKKNMSFSDMKVGQRYLYSGGFGSIRYLCELKNIISIGGIDSYRFEILQSFGCGHVGEYRLESIDDINSYYTYLEGQDAP